MSRELGLIFTMEGDTANFSKMGEGKSSSGQQIADIEVKWAEDGNLKAWQISPASGRPAWKNMNASWFDRLEGKRRYVNASIEGLLGDAKSMGAKASFFAPFEAFTEEQAKAQAKSDSSASRQALAEGWVVIRGEPKATPQAKVLLKGVREGVDGNYIIKKVTHTYKRGGGFETLLDLGDPGVQSDNRGGDSGKANP